MCSYYLNNSILKKSFTFLVFLSVTYGFLLTWYLLEESLRLRLSKSHQSNVTETTCHYIDIDDALSPIEKNSSIPLKSIFFIETSCRGLNSRQACSVESAARVHPHWQINVLFSGPVTNKNLNNGRLNALKQFTNVKLFRLNLLQHIEGTAVEDLFRRGELDYSWWTMKDISDLLGMLTLYKWGGVYLDTDMLVVKSLTPLGQNWIAKRDNVLNNAAIGLSRDHLGRKFAEAVLNEVNTSYILKNQWAYDGASAITRALQKMCNTSKIEKWSSHTCQGLNVYDQEDLYAFRFLKYDRPGESRYERDNYAFYFWIFLPKVNAMKINNDSAYEILAQKFCPTTYKI